MPAWAWLLKESGRGGLGDPATRVGLSDSVRFLSILGVGLMRLPPNCANTSRRPFRSHLARAIGHVLAVLACSVLLTTGTALGQIVWQGDDGTDPTNWDVLANWQGGALPDPADDVDFVGSAGKTIDLMGTSRTVANVRIENMGNAALFQSTGGTATLNFNELKFRNNQSQTTFNVDLAGGRLWNDRKSKNPTFNGSVTASDPTSGPGQVTWHMNGPASFPNGLNFAYRAIAIGGNPVINAYNTVTFGAALNISDRATWNANVDGSMGSGTINVSDLGRLHIGTAQTALPTINVNAFGVLSGNVTGAVYSGGSQNIALAANAVLALTAGPEPTEGDLGLTPGVKDAILWKGATATGTTSAGDDGNSVYKGVAVGQFTPNYYSSSNTYTTPTSDDLSVAMVHNNTGTGARYTGAKFDSPTGVANIDMFGTSEITLRQSLKGTATEYHFRNQGDIARSIVTFDLDAVTAAQEVHVYDGAVSIGNNAAPDVRGRLETHGDAMMRLPTMPIVPAAGTMIVLNDNVAIPVSPGQESVLENLTLGTDLIVNSARPAIVMSVGGAYNFTGAPNPVMTQVLKTSDLCVSSNNNNFFALNEDLTLGDGRYLMNFGSSHKGMTLGNVGDPGKVVADVGASSIGIANFGAPDAGSGSMEINATMDGSGTATIRLGSSTALTAVRGINERATQIPSGTIELNSSAAFVNTPEVAIESGTVRLNAPIAFPGLTLNATLDNNGNTATVNGTLGGTGTWNGTIELAGSGAVNPGNSSGTVTGNTLLMQSGATYQWEVLDPDGVAGTADGWDLIDVNSLTLSTWTLEVLDAGLVRPIVPTDRFEIVAAPAILGFDPSKVTINVPLGWDKRLASVEPFDNYLILSGIQSETPTVIIPEPSTFLIWSLGLLGLAWCARRRRR